MSTKLALTKGVWFKLNTEYALLITGGPYRFFMNGNEAPDADSASHLLTGPQVVPQGVGAYVTTFEEERTLVVSAFVPSDQNPVVPFDVASPEEE